MTDKTASASPSSPPALDASGKKPTVYLVDGSGYVFRAYFALKRLSTSKGVPVNAVFNFATMLLRILKEHDPRYLAIAFDAGGKNFRHALYADYKANRSAPPEDLPPQIPLIHQLVDTFKIPRLVVKGVEADDVLGTAAHIAKEAGHEVVIITGDKDLMQLVEPGVTLLDEMRMGRGEEHTRIGPAEVVARFGVDPKHVVDVLALAGDTSDNVPGVRGIGEKTAAELVRTFGDVESVLARAHEIKQPARREKLLADAEMARLSKQLVTIRRDVPIEFSVDGVRFEGPDRDAVRALFSDLEFRRLLSDPLVRGADGDALPDAGSESVAVDSSSLHAPAVAPRGASSGKRASTSQGDLFGAAAAASSLTPDGLSSGSKTNAEPASAHAHLPPHAHLDRSAYRAVVDAEQLRDVVQAASTSTRIALRTEVDRPGLHARLVGIGLCWRAGEAAWIPIMPLGLDVVRAALVPLLADTGRQIVAHDAKTDLNAMLAAGFPTWQIAGDPMLASYLLDADAEAHTLSNVSRRILGHVTLDPLEVMGTGKNALPFDAVPIDKQTAWVGEAVDVTLRAADALEPMLRGEGMDELYRKMELPLEHLLSRMERAGVKIDIARLRGLSASFVDEIARIEERAHQAAGRPFLLSSPQQIAELLFGELGLPVVKRTKTGPSTDSQVLEALADKHDVPALILEFRTLTKLKNTYLDVLPQLVDARGRVHTHFNQAVAATGRLSSSDPNLQNIPIRTELGRKIRDAFVAEDGHQLISLDYSQIELRILAHVTGDPVMVDTFERDQDVHRRTASEIFDVSPDDVTRDQRTAAKSINFGLLYGMGVVRLSRELGIKRAEAKAYLDKYFERYAGIRDWHSRVMEQAHHEREVRTLLGRRRKLPGLDSKNPGERARAERLAINTPIQGSAADIMKRAMLDADAALSREVPSARILLQVHDELVIEVPDADATHAMRIARDAMSDAVRLRVPLVVDGNIGRTWNEAH